MDVNISEWCQLVAQETRLLLCTKQVKLGPSPNAPPHRPMGTGPLAPLRSHARGRDAPHRPLHTVWMSYLLITG